MAVVELIFLFVFKYTLRYVVGLPLSSSTTETCINVYAEYAQNASSSMVLFQNCNNTWFYGTTRQTKEMKLSEEIKAKSIYLLEKEFIIQSDGNKFFYVNIQGKNIIFLNFSCDSSQFSAIQSDNVIELLILCNQTIKTLYVFKRQRIISFISLLSYGSQLMLMKCSKQIKLCFLLSQLNSLQYLNKQQYIKSVRPLYLINNSLIPYQMELRQLNQSFLEIYISYETGEIGRFLFNNIEMTIEQIKAYDFFNLSNLYQMKVNSSFLVVSDDEANLIIYNVDKDEMVKQLSYRENMTIDDSSLCLDLYIGFNSTLMIFNKANHFRNQRNLRGSGGTISCKLMSYYDKYTKTCLPCSNDCTACYSNNGSCISCKINYFLIEGLCQSCFYSSDILTNYLDKCFSEMQQGVMNTSEQVVTVLTVVLSNFATMLNVCGILFLFVKLINNWSLLSLYFFLPIKNIPFFLENILGMLFMNFNSSVLQALNIKINFEFGIADRNISEKLQLTNITTDFIAYNGENFIMFIYSLILILTILRLIHVFLGRWHLSLFQDNIAIAILEEFIASFTVAYLPFSQTIGFSGYPTLRYKINAILSYTLMLIALMAPFLFLIVGNKQKSFRQSRPINLTDPDETNKILKECMINSKKVWITESQRQKCFYCILSFSISLLACNSEPVFFLFIVGLVHILSVLNVLWSPGWSINLLAQKINFLLFHGCYILLYSIEGDQVKLYLSIAAVFFIILGGTHELVSTVFSQFRCLKQLIRRKCKEKKKIQALITKIDEAKSDNLRCHPMNLSFLPKKQKIRKQKTTRLNLFAPQIINYQTQEPSSLASDRVQIDEQDSTGRHVKMKLKPSRKKPTKSVKQINKQANTDREQGLEQYRQEGKSQSRIGRSRRKLRIEE